MHVHDLANSHKVFKSEKGFNSDDLHSRLAFVKYFKNSACKWLGMIRQQYSPIVLYFVLEWLFYVKELNK